jgi:hypothetical protein
MARRTQPSRRRGTRRLALLAIPALAAAGCGGDDDAGAPPAPPQDRPPAGSGYFVGTDPEGLGASIDLSGYDDVLARVRARLAAAEPGSRAERITAVGVVSLVNTGTLPRAVPRFIAVLDGGGAVPLPAASIARDLPDRAAAALPPQPLIVPAGGSATAYVALSGAPPERLDHLKMVVAPGQVTRLPARRR